jgi:hypothetical protein
VNTDRAPTGFDPANLTPSASLNRALIADLPGIAPDPDVRGLTGSELLSAQALATAIGTCASTLGLHVASNPLELLPAFDRCLDAHDAAVRAAARTLAQRFGRSLGYFLVMLHRGELINRRARDDWDDACWEYWAGVRTVWLGGGIASGRLGTALREHAAAVLEECGCSAPTLHLARHAAILPLIGAARSLPASPTACPTEAAIVFDFGGTTIKRAHATYTGGALASLNILSPLPTTHLTLGRSSAPSGATETAYQFAERIADIIATTWRTATSPGFPLIPHVVVSLACYVRDGHPLLRQSGRYTDLCALPQPAERVLSRLVSELIGQAVTVTLLHDGTAAARTYAETPNAAVIMLGTALGVGFPPPAIGALRLLAPHFSITPAR